MKCLVISDFKLLDTFQSYRVRCGYVEPGNRDALLCAIISTARKTLVQLCLNEYDELIINTINTMIPMLQIIEKLQWDWCFHPTLQLFLKSNLILSSFYHLLLPHSYFSLIKGASQKKQLFQTGSVNELHIKIPSDDDCVHNFLIIRKMFPFLNEGFSNIQFCVYK